MVKSFWPLTPETGVRFPVGSPIFFTHSPTLFLKHSTLKTVSIFRATFILRAKVYGADKKVYFDNSYTEVGIRQGAKMFWGGAFAMKSAIRQSSFGALKKIFASLRRDLTNVLVQNKID